MFTRAFIGALLLLVGGLAAPAGSRAEDPAPVEINAASEQTVVSEHFVVHYITGGAPGSAAPVTPEIAQKVSADAEAALAFYSKLGFPAPLSDATMPELPGRRTVRVGSMRWAAPWWDGKVDIYVLRLGGGVLGRAVSGSTVVPTAPGVFVVDYRATSRTTAHELFHLIQFAIFRRATLDILLGEALANWGAYRFTGQGPAASAPRWGEIGPAALRTPWASLDCRSNCGYASRRGGYDQWPFFQYLSERFGDGVIREILQASASLGAADRKPHGFEAISAALANHGSSLTRAFGDYTGARLDGSFKHPLLAGKTMTVNTKLVAGRRQNAIWLDVDHLAARAVLLRVRGKGKSCRSRRVKLTVNGGGPSAAFVAQVGGRAQQLQSNGRRAQLITKPRACGRLGPRFALANIAPSGPQTAFRVTARALP